MNLDDVITPEQIDEAERLGACPDVIRGLRESPRTWRDLGEHDRVWAVRHAPATLGREACMALLDGCQTPERVLAVCYVHATLGRDACLALLVGCDPGARAWAMRRARSTLNPVAAQDGASR